MKASRFKEKKKMKLSLKILLLVFICVFLYSLYNIIYWMKSNNELKELETGIFAEVVQEIEVEEGEPEKVIDFDKLLEINSDVVGWISIENAGINYPILQANDNEYYLKRDLYKNSNSCGSIYLDCDTNKDFSDPNTVIYGHHLTRGGMFTDLDKIYNGELGNEVYIQIYTLENSYKYQVIASYVAKPSLELVKRTFNNNEREQYLDNAINNSKVEFKEVENMQENILTLVTCHGTQRTVVNAIRVE